MRWPAAGENAGVVVAEANLKFIWDVVSNMHVGEGGHAYVVDARGRLIAHPDISLVLQKSDLSALPQIRAASAAHGAGGEQLDQAIIGQDLAGRKVLSALRQIAPLGWLVFVDLPVREAFAPIYASVMRTLALLLVGLLISVLASLYLVRRMVSPIRALQAGAARIGSGELDHRIQVKTGDELEALAGEFNGMAARLEESYAGLEKKVEDRTRDLTEALEQQTATGGGPEGNLLFADRYATGVRHDRDKRCTPLRRRIRDPAPILRRDSDHGCASPGDW